MRARQLRALYEHRSPECTDPTVRPRPGKAHRPHGAIERAHPEACPLEFRSGSPRPATRRPRQHVLTCAGLAPGVRIGLLVVSAVSFRESQHRPAVTGQPLAHRARSPARAFRRGFSSHVLSHASHRLCGRPRTQGLRHGLGSRSPVRLDAPGHGLRPVPCGPRAAPSTSTGASSGPSIRCCKVCSLTRPRYRIFLIPSLDGDQRFSPVSLGFPSRFSSQLWCHGCESYVWRGRGLRRCRRSRSVHRGCCW